MSLIDKDVLQNAWKNGFMIKECLVTTARSTSLKCLITIARGTSLKVPLLAGDCDNNSNLLLSRSTSLKVPLLAGEMFVTDGMKHQFESPTSSWWLPLGLQPCPPPQLFLPPPPWCQSNPPTLVREQGMTQKQSVWYIFTHFLCNKTPRTNTQVN